MPDRALPTTESALHAGMSWGGEVLATLLKAKKRVMIYVLVGTTVAVFIALAIRNQYTSSAAFIAQGSTSLNLPTALQGAALSLGLERGNDYSPKFYADLLTSRPVLQSAILHQYHVVSDGDTTSKNYLTIEGFNDDPLDRALDKGLK